MSATPFEFRFRYLIHLVLYAIAFSAPWNFIHRVDTYRDTWSWLVIFLPLHTSMKFQSAAVLCVAHGIFFALAAVILRTWGAAYIGTDIVKDGALHGASIVAGGPYRFVRNPLYLGTYMHTFALALLMPPSGAIFAILVLGLLQLRLIFAEEPFLAAKLGQPYLDYKARVPRLVPALTPRISASAAKPAWLQAILGEIYFWGVFVTFAGFAWQYNAMPMWRGILISLGVSIIVRALLPKAKSA